MKKTLILLTLFFGLVAGAAAQNSGSPHVRTHTRLQVLLSYETRIKENKAFTRQSARTALKSAKEAAKARRKRQKAAARRERIYTKIDNLKN